jgi:hypothetical protein
MIIIIIMIKISLIIIVIIVIAIIIGFSLYAYMLLHSGDAIALVTAVGALKEAVAEPRLRETLP